VVKIGGNSYDLRVTVGSIGRVMRGCGANLADLTTGTPNLLERLMSDMPLVGTVLWHLVEPQAVAAGVTDQAFADALDGETFAAAHAALLDSLSDFFRPLRPEIADVIAKEQGFRKAVGEQVIAELPGIVRRNLDKVRTLIATGERAGNSPESSA
jgi:hypothetical protein